jgi:HK97 family phage portal protein
VAKLRDLIDRFIWPIKTQEERGYPITGDLSGFYSYMHQSLNNVATASSVHHHHEINQNQAMRIATLFACVLVRGESLSSLRASVLQADANGSHPAYTHPAYYLVHDRPNPFQTAADYWKSVSAHVDLDGECFAKVSYSGRYQPTQIKLIEDHCAVDVKMSASGECYYTYEGRDYADYEMLHFKDLSLDGYRGCSKIRYNAETIGYAKKLKNYGNNAIGVKPPGYFSTQAPFGIVKKQEKGLSDGWSENIANGKTPVLPMGMEYKSLQINPGDAQYLEAVDATKEDICAIMRVPPTLVQNYLRATFANAEQQDLVFVKHTMLPMITNIEQECNSKLFSEANKTSATPFYVKFNVNAFLRGDFKTRTEGYRTLWERGLITGNMVADLEDWNHFDGGDRRFVPMNMIPLDKIDDFIDKLTQPVDTNVSDNGSNNQRSGEDVNDFLDRINKKLNGHAN